MISGSISVGTVAVVPATSDVHTASSSSAIATTTTTTTTTSTSTAAQDCPLTVDELLASYQRVQRINGDLCKFIEKIRVECNSLAERCPHAAEALRNALQVSPVASQADAGVATAVALKEGGQTASSRSSDGGNNVVLEGVVVKGFRTHSSPQPSVEDAATKPHLLSSVEGVGRYYKEEINALQLKLLAMCSAEQLLANSRMKVRELEERCAAYASSLNVCRAELLQSRSQCSVLLRMFPSAEKSGSSGTPTTTAVTTSVPAKEEERVLERSLGEEEEEEEEGEGENSCGTIFIRGDTDAPVDAASSTAKPSLRTLAARMVQAEIALQEAKAALEGREWALKKMSYEKDQLRASVESIVGERDMLKMHNAQLEGQLQRLLSSMHEDASEKRNSHDTAAVWNPGGGRQSDMTLDVKGMQQHLQRLQRENRALQDTVLQFQRQINDAELRAEESVASTDEAELRAMKEELSRLRPALHMGELALQQVRRERQCAAAQWRLQERVHRTVIHHLSTQILQRISLILLSDRRKMDEEIVTSGETLAEEASVDVGVNPSAISASVLEEESRERQEEDEKIMEEGGEMLAATSSCKDDRVMELHALLEAHESNHRSSMKHWQQVNQELRTALANSQKELRQQGDRIKLLEEMQCCRTIGATVQDTPDVSSEEASLAPQAALLQLLHAENGALTRRVTELQESKWSLDTLAEEYKARCTALEREIAHNAETMNYLLKMGAILPAATHIRGGSSTDTPQLRSLQRMLHHTLQDNMALRAKLGEFEA